MTRYAIVLTLITLSSLAACSKSQTSGNVEPTVQPTNNSVKRVGSTDVVKVEPAIVDIAAGGSSEATIKLAIQNGYHVNANPPTYPYLIPTALEVAPSDGLSIGQITYPPPITIKLSFAEKPLAVYEGETAIKATIRADPSIKPGERTLPAKMRIQACDNQVCFPPAQLSCPFQ